MFETTVALAFLKEFAWYIFARALVVRNAIPKAQFFI